MSAAATPSATHRARNSISDRSSVKKTIAASPHTTPSTYGRKKPMPGTASAIRICRKNPNAVSTHTAASIHLSRPII